MATGILDLDTDSLVLCASKLGLRDLASMAMSCRRLKDAAYADLPWQIQCRIRWPTIALSYTLHGSREAYLARHIASQQFRFADPFQFAYGFQGFVVSEILLDVDRALLAQGAHILVAGDGGNIEYLTDHNARLTCMRLYHAPEAATSIYRSSFGGASKFLATASADHTIRIWGKKGTVFRTLRGHSGPVRVIADRQLPENVLASGGMDGTVRLWSVFSRRKVLQATLHGHESYVKELIVSRDNLLLSAAKDCKLRVWNPAASKPLCIGMTRGPGVPASLKSDGSLCYFAGGSKVALIDLRTMQTVRTVAQHEDTILAMALSSSASLLCTGGKEGLAKLWDIRKDEMLPVSTLGQHQGTVDFVHVDLFKAVIAGREDPTVRVWDSRTGELITSMPGEGLITAMAVEGTRIATASQKASGDVRFNYRDYDNSIAELESENEGSGTSKFWDHSTVEISSE